MKKNTAILLTAVFAAALSATGAAAMNHGHGAKAGHGPQAHAAAGHEAMIRIGEATVEGVRGEVHLNDVREAMKKAGMDATHHFMIAFTDTATGKPVTEGVVALKITGPDGKTGEARRLVGMDGHFGADIPLAHAGNYTFDIGTKLPDGKTRTFTVTHELK